MSDFEVVEAGAQRELAELRKRVEELTAVAHMSITKEPTTEVEWEEVEGRCSECDYVFYYKIDPNDPDHWKICPDCIEKGVIEP